MLQKYTFKSPTPGLSVLFLGAIHGNEPAGTKAIFKVVEKFASRALIPLKGSVTFIPVCNPRAFEQNVRQIDQNLNRIITKYDTPQTYEQQLADELDDYIAAADVTIDLHSVSAPEAEPFVFNDYPDALADKLAAAQTVKYIIKGWPEIYAQSDTIKDLSTASCAHRHNRTCLTIECGSHTDTSAVQNAYYAIMNTLLALNMVEGFPAAPVKQKQIVIDEMIIKTAPGHLSQNFKHLDYVKKDDVLAIYDDGQKVICAQDGWILLPKAQALVNSEWFYLGRLHD